MLIEIAFALGYESFTKIFIGNFLGQFFGLFFNAVFCSECFFWLIFSRIDSSTKRLKELEERTYSTSTERVQAIVDWGFLHDENFKKRTAPSMVQVFGTEIFFAKIFFNGFS